MIASRPQTSSLIALIAFALITWSLWVINLLSLIRDPEPPWFNYLFTAVLPALALFTSYRIFFRYKIIQMGNGEIIVRYPQFGIRRRYLLKEILSWAETTVRTGGNSPYRELEICFGDGRRITMALREYTSYEKMEKYLREKAAGKEKKQIKNPVA